jgi:hypothetical protein
MVKTYNDALEWAAKWIEDTLRAGPETHVRTIEFGTNMAMTLRAAKLSGADLLRATAFRPMCDDPECSVCKRMAELHAENAPSVTGETTVETALAELREMFPHNELSIQFVSSSPIDQWWQITVGNKTFYGQRNANPRLADCMAQVRAATRTEGET